jgi:hypothetical protein
MTSAGWLAKQLLNLCSCHSFFDAIKICLCDTRARRKRDEKEKPKRGNARQHPARDYPPLLCHAQAPLRFLWLLGDSN